MIFLTLAYKYYSDIMFVKIRYLQQNKCTHVFIDGGGGATYVYPFSKKYQAPEALITIIQDFGVHRDLVTDGSMEDNKGHWDILDKVRIRVRESEPYLQCQNLAEGEIRELKRLMNKNRLLYNIPTRLGDYIYKLCPSIRHLIIRKYSCFRAPAENRLCDTPEISDYAELNWYQYVWYIDPADPLNEKKLARYIGVALNIGVKMNWSLLPPSYRTIARSCNPNVI